tara:strand:+ start:1058 stop:1750 length:693 start_codon:yes stop_codon:yes gene_type:complete
MQSYWLNPHVHFCECDDALIFLDVTRDMYFRFTGAQREWFNTICAASEADELPAHASRFAERLVARKVLTQDTAAGKNPVATSFPAPHASLPKLVTLSHPSRTAKTALDLSIATLSSWTLEHSRNFEGVIDGVMRWKREERACQSAPIERVLHRVADFHAMTPYFFSTRDACRFRSLVLMNYLTRSGIAPDWVFGVRLCPFSAHCWVEYNGVILNEDSDTVAEFRPIMSV